MSQQTDLKQLSAEVRRLEELLHDDGVASRRSGNVPLLVSAMLAVIIAGFLLTNYFWFRSQLTTEKLTASLEKELAEVGPTAVRHISLLGQDLLPVYAAEWKKNLQRSWPEIAQKIESEVVSFGDDVLLEVHNALQDTQNLVVRETEESVLASYPSLRNTEQREILEERLRASCESALSGALIEFDGLFSADVQRVENALLRFDLSDTNESTVDLQKKAIHLWLQLLDQEVMEL